jgi:hypothetical protein
MENIITTIILGFIISFSVSAKKINGDVSPIFDISPNGKSLILAIHCNWELEKENYEDIKSGIEL